MSVVLNPYLNFADGKAREAMEFYASVLGGEATFGDNVSVSIAGDDAEKMRRWFDALSVDAQAVTTPLDTQPWGDVFGSFKDRYGISWLFNIAGDAGS
jgi:PhnB protein